MNLVRRVLDALLSARGASSGMPTGVVPGDFPGGDAAPDHLPGGQSTADAGAADQPAPHYAPERDGEPDPGEIVWAWVAYEDDPSQGKDRPVLLVGRDGDTWLALQLTSKDHDRDAEDEARWGRFWIDIGSGDWDPQRRPSEVRLDRLLRLDADGIRREGAALDQAVFAEVVDAAARFHHWS
ncbi:MAG: type II toxin-antitoxin system PemK/MazF family toxin [Nocardioides sp.]